ncbi:hypothetical protein F4802DRAFT_317521 [Xylaria palmicola]|nr:hypothetical protein F4802DRAFT_317521 [Xylaria palmicola]
MRRNQLSIFAQLSGSQHSTLDVGFVGPLPCYYLALLPAAKPFRSPDTTMRCKTRMHCPPKNSNPSSQPHQPRRSWPQDTKTTRTRPNVPWVIYIREHICISSLLCLSSRVTRQRQIACAPPKHVFPQTVYPVAGPYRPRRVQLKLPSRVAAACRREGVSCASTACPPSIAARSPPRRTRASHRAIGAPSKELDPTQTQHRLMRGPTKPRERFVRVPQRAGTTGTHPRSTRAFARGRGGAGDPVARAYVRERVRRGTRPDSE